MHTGYLLQIGSPVVRVAKKLFSMLGFYCDKLSSSLGWEASIFMTVGTADQAEEETIFRRVMLGVEWAWFLF